MSWVILISSEQDSQAGEYLDSPRDLVQLYDGDKATFHLSSESLLLGAV